MNGRGRSFPEVEDSARPGRWMVTFNDLMTLLLTFLILILTFSALQPEKASQAAASAVSALGAVRLGGNMAKRIFPPIVRPYLDRDIAAEKARRSSGRRDGTVRDRRDAVAAALAAVPGSRIDAVPGGFALYLPWDSLLAGESLRLGSSAVAVLDRLAFVSRGGGAQISITLPGERRVTGVAGVGDLERAILRSDVVARYLSEAGGVPAERISISGTRLSGGGPDRGSGPPAGEIRLGVAFSE
jgi:hypothetical protein